jgi:4-hydroxybenzoate polyprenyltransferase
MITRSIRGSLVLAAILLASAYGLSLLADFNWVGPDMPDRVTQVMIGLILVLFGNATGKREKDADPADDGKPALMAARRFFGLALVLGGLVHAGAWLLAPLELANTVSMVAVIAALVAGLARVAYAVIGQRETPGKG